MFLLYHEVRGTPPIFGAWENSMKILGTNQLFTSVRRKDFWEYILRSYRKHVRENDQNQQWMQNIFKQAWF